MRAGFLAVAALAPVAADAATYTINPGDDLYGRLSQLVAGDEVVVHAGTYVTPGFYEVTWTGSEARPILVRGADGERPTLQGTPSQNVINLSGSYFTLRGFEIVGGSHGIRLGSADHATLADLRIHGLGDVGISCNRPGMTCDVIFIRQNEIYDTGAAGTGEGMYLGCNDAGCMFENSLVELNYVHDLGGSQGDGIEVKTGAFGVTVRDNVIVRSGYPGITMYGFSGANARNVVERNLVWGTQDNGIQLVGQIIVRNNIVLGAGANGIQSKGSQGALPHDVDIVHNTVVGAGGACLKTNDWSGQTGQLIANNALYCPGGTALDINGGAPAAIVVGNLGLGSGATQGQSLAADLGDPAHAAVYPPDGSALVRAGTMPPFTGDDFNGLRRSHSPPDVGAYERSSATNPGWAPVEGFKTLPVVSIPDAGPPPPMPDAPPKMDAGPVSGGSAQCGCGRDDGGASAANAAFMALAALVGRRRPFRSWDDPSHRRSRRRPSS